MKQSGVWVVFCIILLTTCGCGQSRVDVKQASTVHILSNGADIMHGRMIFGIGGGGGLSAPRDCPTGNVVFIVRDFIGMDKKFIATAKSLGLKEGKAYLRIEKSDKYVFTYIRDIDAGLSDTALCKQFGVED